MLRFLHQRRYRRAVDHAAEELLGAFGLLAPDEARRASRCTPDARERDFCEAVAMRLLCRIDGERRADG